ncbi:MAG: RDD family protein [Nanoarchaeota archaeon]
MDIADLDLPGQRTVSMVASVGKRFVSLLIDLAVLNLAVFAPFATTLEGMLTQSVTVNMAIMENPPLGLQVIIASLILVALAYFTLFQFFFAQTIGMRLVRIRVEGKVSLWSAFVRSVFIVPLFPFYLLWVIDPILIIKDGRSLPERITGTRTVEKTVI